MIRGKKRDIVPDVEIKASIHNRFDIEVIDSETGEIKQKAYGENIITNKLWDLMFASNSSDPIWNKYIHYGSGSGTPAVTDTGLFNYVGYGTPSSDDDVKSYDSANGVFSYRRKIILDVSTAVGITLTEVGISLTGPNYGYLCTHAMLKDMNGNQISITKTSTDIINIYSTVFCHFDGAFRSFCGLSRYSTLLLFAVGRAGNPISSGMNMTDVSGNVASSLIDFTKVVDRSLKKVTLNCTRIGVNECNGAGFLEIAENSNLFTMYCDGWYSGTVITGESIGTGDGTTKDFKTKFGLVKSGAQIYVDGVEATNAIIDIDNPTDLTNILHYMKEVDLNGKLNKTSAVTSVPPNTKKIFYNPLYAIMGVAKVYGVVGSSVNFECSNDLTTWTVIGNGIGSSGMDVPTNLKNYKYWRASGCTVNNWAYIKATTTDITQYNIHFAAEPASGAEITADYTTALIAKDANHVFDMSMSFTFGEYAGA